MNKKMNLKKHRNFLFLLVFLGFSIPMMAQQIIKGKVTDNKNMPLPGVNVLVKGTNNGITTDYDGSYKIEANDGAELEFTFVGFSNKTVKVNGKTTINVELSSDAKNLDEVIVVGYGTQKKKDVTAAVVTVDVSKRKDIPATSVSQMLIGQATGVTVQQGSGAPGGELDITIRGMGSLGAGSKPLYVVDGFPVGETLDGVLNPNDVESISILKDAVSTAIYGARGSNGVVLITTKNAKAGESKISIKVNTGFQNIPDSRRSKMLNGQEFAQFKKDSYMDKIRYYENREPSIDEVPIDYRYPEQTKYSTNWLDAIMNKNALFRDMNLTIANGNGGFKSLVSMGVISQEGVLINTNYKNYSARANITGKVNDFTTLGFNLDANMYERNGAWTDGRSSIIGAALLMDPRDPIYNADGSYNSYVGNHGGSFGWGNPVQTLKETTDKTQGSNILVNTFLEFSIVKGLKFKTAFNGKINQNEYKYFSPSTVSQSFWSGPPPVNAYQDQNAYKTINWAADQLLTYEHNFGEHRFDVLLGYSAQDEKTTGLSGHGEIYPDDTIRFLDSAQIKSAGSTEYGWGMKALFGRFNYSYANKYLLSGTIRKEGSSRFGEDNKYGVFPAFSAGWRVTQEEFMPKLSWLTDMKLRTSYGTTGNNNIGNYSSASYMNNNNYVFGGNFSAGKVVGSLSNPELGWEKSQELDFGLDLVLFKDMLTFTAEYYHKITSDMLLPVQLPGISGYTSFMSNIGKVQNNGLEFALKYKTKINEVNLWSNFNISFNRNKVLAIRGENDEIWNGSMDYPNNVSKVGQPMGMLYGFKVLGIYQNQAEIDNSPRQDGAIPGVYKYLDGNGNGKIDYTRGPGSDMVAIGNPWPKATYGFGFGGDYKKFDLNVLFTGAYKYDIYRQIETSTMNMDGVFNVLVDSKDRWRSEQNPGNGLFATTNTGKYERDSSSRYIYDGSHAWLKNVSLGYTLPKAVNHLADLRVFVSGDNLFLFTKYPGNNPEVNANGGVNVGVDDEAYPIARTFSMGVNLNF